jgi:hypothetical protein
LASAVTLHLLSLSVGLAVVSTSFCSAVSQI